MLTVEELRERCHDLRAKRASADEALVREISSDVDEYRDYLVQPRPQEPPDVLAKRLPLMGWLIYEATWDSLQRVVPAFDAVVDERGEASRAADRLVAKAADAARSLPWPEFAPRALGAIRAQALVESKRDTEQGYSAAWILHEEARARLESYQASHGNDESRKEYRLALKEVLLQLALAETGTACRTAERVIGRWAEELDVENPTWKDNDSDNARWTQRMFQELSQGVSIGGQALDVAAEIEREHGFATQVDERRLALPTAFRNPGIMTARAALLMLAMCCEMENLRRRPVFGHETWEQMRKALLDRFEHAYRAIEKPIYDEHGKPVPLSADHQRSLVQIRLNLALLAPGYSLPSTLLTDLVFDRCLERDPLDAGAVEELSGWLAEEVDGRRRGDANVIGSATKPSFIRSVEACRASFYVHEGYRQWRQQWPKLDRYAEETGRQERVRRVLWPDASGT